MYPKLKSNCLLMAVAFLSLVMVPHEIKYFPRTRSFALEESAVTCKAREILFQKFVFVRKPQTVCSRGAGINTTKEDLIVMALGFFPSWRCSVWSCVTSRTCWRFHSFPSFRPTSWLVFQQRNVLPSHEWQKSLISESRAVLDRALGNKRMEWAIDERHLLCSRERCRGLGCGICFPRGRMSSISCRRQMTTPTEASSRKSLTCHFLLIPQVLMHSTKIMLSHRRRFCAHTHTHELLSHHAQLLNLTDTTDWQIAVERMEQRCVKFLLCEHSCRFRSTPTGRTTTWRSPVTSATSQTCRRTSAMESSSQTSSRLSVSRVPCVKLHRFFSVWEFSYHDPTPENDKRLSQAPVGKMLKCTIWANWKSSDCCAKLVQWNSSLRCSVRKYVNRCRSVRASQTIGKSWQIKENKMWKGIWWNILIYIQLFHWVNLVWNTKPEALKQHNTVYLRRSVFACNHTVRNLTDIKPDQTEEQLKEKHQSECSQNHCFEKGRKKYCSETFQTKANLQKISRENN